MKPHPLTTISEELKLYGLQRRRDWAYDATLRPDDPATGKPFKPLRTCLTPRKEPASPFTPKVEQPVQIAKQSGSGAAGCSLLQNVKKFPVIVSDRVTGEQIEVMTRIVTNTLHVVAYGNGFAFKKTNRGRSIFDSRDNKRKSPDYVKGELVRMLGETRGVIAFDSLCAV